ncbi:MAG: hypothetical protein VX498_05405 [Myxococcota bacterium]|nr:hypothetical protein [Myxococcota bacterium]
MSQILLPLAPFRLVLVGLVLLTASGLWLHEIPRFRSAAWGMTEMLHVWVGWACLAVLIAYLGHHLVLKWGPMKRPQRVLGLLLLVVLLVLMGSGALLTFGRVGGYPDLVRDSHYLSTFALVLLVLLHATVPWRKALRRRFGRRSRDEGTDLP